ncbi:MAG: SwmB domain-containing protein [bacterium]|nr:SwmB domain-containing protein [bacterium]
MASSDSSVAVTSGDFELTCPTGTVAENATLTCTLKNTSEEAKPWPVVAILHLSTDDDRALVRGTSIDVTLGTPTPSAAIDGGVTWIGDTLVGYSRFDWSGNAGAEGTPGNSRTVNIVAQHDSLDEDSERFYVALGPDGSRGVGILYNSRASVTLTDDDGPSTDTSLSSLSLSAGQSYTLSPTQAAQSQTVAYEVTEATLTAEAARGTTMTMSASFGDSSLDLDGRGATSIEVISGQESAAVPLAVGTTHVALTATAEDGITTGTHTVSIVRSALGVDVDTVAVSVPSFTLTCPAAVDKATEVQCTLLASGSAGWPVVAVIHSSADGASRALVAEDPIIPDTDPHYSKDVTLGEQQPARTAFNHGYGELFSGGSRTLYRTYGYEKFDWTGTASAGDTRTVTIQIHDSDVNSGVTAEVFYAALAPSGYTGLSQLVDNKVPILITLSSPAVTAVEVVSDPGEDDIYTIGDTISLQVTFSEAVNVTGAPTLGIDMDPADGGREDAVYAGGTGTTQLTFDHTVIERDYSIQGIAVVANTLALNGGTITAAAGGADVDLAHTGLDHDSDHKVNWQNRPPVFRSSAVVYVNALPGVLDAPPGFLVSLPLSKDDFSDPDGDELTFEMSASRDDVYVQDGLIYSERLGRVFFLAKTACALLEDLSPSPGELYETVVTMTATDPEGETAHATLMFRTNPANTFHSLDLEDACPSVSGAAVDGSTLMITLDGVVAPSYEPPTAAEFAVKVDGAAVGVAGVGALALDDTTIALTLASRVTSGQTVTVSYTPGHHPVAAAFADQPVTNNSRQNRPPVFRSSAVVYVNALPGVLDAPPGFLVSLPLSKDDFSDPDGDELTFEMSASRDDVYVQDGLIYSERLGRVFFLAKTACALLEDLSPSPGELYETVVTMTATDPEGETAHATLMFRTNPANTFHSLDLEDACPSVSGAAVDGSTLMITLDGVVAPSYEPPTAAEFAVKVDGAAVGVAGVGALALDDTTIALTLASRVTSGQTVTVSYTPGHHPVAAAFADQPVTNNSPAAPTPVCVTAPEGVTAPICAAVSGDDLLVTFSGDLAAIDSATADLLRYAILVDGAYVYGAPVDNQSASRVVVDGATLTLTLGTPILAGDEVTVRYFASGADNGLKDSDGNAIPDFTLTVITTAS